MVLQLLFVLVFFRNISFASVPVATISPVFLSIATTDGSFKIIPFPFIVTKIFAVPRSMPISFEPKVNNLNISIFLSFILSLF